jgi:Transposase IS4
VDEIILKFEGRSSQKITISCKPIPTGFKLFALGDSGYIYNWECTRPGVAEGFLQEKKRVSISIPNSSISANLNLTQSVVIRLVNSLSKFTKDGLSFHLYLDNLFVCWKSVQALKERGIAVTGTVRKGASGYPPRLLQLKKMNRALEWGALQASIIEGVACWLWQDANAVMGMLLFLIFLLLFLASLFSFKEF